jgi:surfeit locus 1 family protein
MVLLRPRWIAGHLLALVLTTAFIAAGIWQIARNDEAHRKLQEAKAAFAAPAPGISTINVAAGAGTSSRATATGTFFGSDALLRNQLRGSASGYDVLSPLRLDDGTAVIIDRGWISLDRLVSGALDTARPTGPVTVRGVLQPVAALRPGEQVQVEDGLSSLPRVDVARLGGSGGGTGKFLPAYLVAQSISPTPAPAAPALPKPTSNAEVNQVDHISYAIQWFSFAAIAVIGWPIVLWHFTRRRRPRPLPA